MVGFQENTYRNLYFNFVWYTQSLKIVIMFSKNIIKNLVFNPNEKNKACL